MLVTAMFAIIVLSVVLVLGNIFKKLLDLLVNQNAPADLILSFIGYVLPFSLTFTIPWGFLTAVLLVFGRLSAENELTALRASGVSIARACLPVALIGVVFTGICLWINFQVAPRAQEQMKTALFKIATENPLSMFRSDEVIDAFPGKKIFVERNNGNQLENFLVYDVDQEDSSLRSVMFAKKGELLIHESEPSKGASAGDKQLLLQMKDGRYEERDEEHPDDLSRFRNGITVEEGSTAISLKELYDKNRKAGGLGTFTLGQLIENEKPEAMIELNKRFSNALATLAFGLLAIPLAITAQRKETSVGFAISLGIGLSYYLLFFLADLARNKPGLSPHLLVWLPNILFIAIGLWRFRVMMRR